MVPSGGGQASRCFSPGSFAVLSGAVNYINNITPHVYPIKCPLNGVQITGAWGRIRTCVAVKARDLQSRVIGRSTTHAILLY